ncbi:MAG: hypothetical protein J5611_01890 [Alphaproteobacteria bacterium]|nr:hypothetical protein [Alphaproteobacteria bacterium]
MKKKLKNYFVWCAVTGRASKAMCQAELALKTKYDSEEFVHQDNITRKDCIAYAVDPVLEPGRDEVGTAVIPFQYKYCDFYKKGVFCGVAENGCKNRTKNLDCANKVMRYKSARKRRGASFKALFVPDWLKAKLFGRSK